MNEDYTTYKLQYFERGSRHLADFKTLLDRLWKEYMGCEKHTFQWEWSKVTDEDGLPIVTTPEETFMLRRGGADFPLVFSRFELEGVKYFDLAVGDILDKTFYKHHAKEGDPLYDTIRKWWLRGNWVEGDGVEQMCEAIRNADLVAIEDTHIEYEDRKRFKVLLPDLKAEPKPWPKRFIQWFRNIFS